jgi:NADH-quinone oxidoreductase subunit C
MMDKTVLEALTAKFGTETIYRTTADFGDLCAYVQPEKLREVASFLKQDDSMRFDFPVFCTCIDRLYLPPTPGTDPDVDPGPRFEVCWEIRSGAHRHRLRLKVQVPETNVKVPTLSDIWPGMNWCERETFDMYGIIFEGHPSLRRIYMYDEFVGHPLRKDYPKEKRQPLVRREWGDEPLASDRDRAMKER